MVILIIDNDVSVHKTALQTPLKKDCDVHIARNGWEAYNLCQKIRPDLILLDILMPSFNELDLFRMIRTYDRDIPIIIMSDYTIESDMIADLMMNGVSSFLRKPFGERELMAHIARHKILPKSYLLGDCRFTPSPGTIDTGKGEPCRLTPLETAVMTLLCENTNLYVDRATFEKNVWKCEHTDSRAVDSLINRLREKLKNISLLTIETSYGRGYRLTMQGDGRIDPSIENLSEM